MIGGALSETVAQWEYGGGLDGAMADWHNEGGEMVEGRWRNGKMAVETEGGMAQYGIRLAQYGIRLAK